MLKLMETLFFKLLCMTPGYVTLQDGGDGAIVLNMEDHDEIPKAVVKPP